MEFGAGAGKGTGRQGGDPGGQRKGFFRSLFDLSFTSFVTGRVVSFVYVLSLVLVTLYVFGTVGYLCILAYAFVGSLAESEAVGAVIGVVLFLILAPLLLFVSVVYVRVLLEIVIVLFRIAENTAELVHQGHESAPSETTPSDGPSGDPPDGS